MQSYRWMVLFFMMSVISGCADFNTGHPPAPVFGGPPDDNIVYDAYGRPIPNEPGQTIRQPPPQVIETKPLQGFNKAPDIIEIKPDIPPPQDHAAAQPDSGRESSPDQSYEAANPFGTEQPSDNSAMSETEAPADEPKPAEPVTPVAPPLPEVPKEPDALEPLESFGHQSPAVGSLMMAANENTQNGNLDSAVSSIERAIRIEPRNASLYYKLAVLRLKQSKPRLAEDLARKAAILAANDNALKKHSWLLIANARELQNNVDGAKKAKIEASKY